MSVFTDLIGTKGGVWYDLWTTLLTRLTTVTDAIETQAATSLRGTSTTSATVGAGAKSLTIQTGKAFSAGDWINAFDTSNPTTQWMVGQVDSYTTATGVLAFTVTSPNYVGSATVTTWTVAISARPGPEGPAGTLATPAQAVAGTSAVIGTPPASLIVSIHANARAF